MQLGKVAPLIDRALALCGTQGAHGLLFRPMWGALQKLFLRSHNAKRTRRPVASCETQAVQTCYASVLRDCMTRIRSSSASA